MNTTWKLTLFGTNNWAFFTLFSTNPTHSIFCRNAVSPKITKIVIHHFMIFGRERSSNQLQYPKAARLAVFHLISPNLCLIMYTGNCQNPSKPHIYAVLRTYYITFCPISLEIWDYFSVRSAGITRYIQLFRLYFIEFGIKTS